jgi:hypothetical protein
MVDVSSPKIFEKSSAIVVEEFRLMNDQALETGRRLDDKAISLIEWSSIALVIASALELQSLAQGQVITPLIILVVAVILYLSVVVLCLIALWPQDYELPLPIEWNGLYDLYLSKEEDSCLTQVIAQYMAAIGHNRKRTTSKALFVRIGFALLPILIVVLVLLATHDLWQGLLP